jgi:hypothetical protein
LSLASIACLMSAAQLETPTPVPSLSPSATPAPTVTPTPHEPHEGDVSETAIVRQPTVNVRDAAGGDPTGDYVVAGQEVTVLETVTMENGDEWVRIAEPAGWIFAGCLEGSERGCAAE